MTLINKLADMLGCQGLKVDTHGRLLLAPYIAPEDKPLLWTYRPTAWGRNAVYEPGVGVEDNTRTIPNRVITEYTTASGGYSVIADLDPSHPCSFQRRGWYTPEAYTYSECPSREWLQAKATSQLKEVIGSRIRYKIRAGFVPHDIGQVGRLIYQDQPDIVAYDEIVLMQTKQYDLTPGLPTAYTLKKARAITSADIILSGTGV